MIALIMKSFGKSRMNTGSGYGMNKGRC